MDEAHRQMCAEMARQQHEEQRRATESVLPVISLSTGMEGTFFIPIPMFYGGIKIVVAGTFTGGPCCLNGQLTSYTDRNYSILAGWAAMWPLPQNSIEPIATINVDSYKPCPSPSSLFDVFIAVRFSVSSPFVECQYSFRDLRWSCSGGIDLTNTLGVEVSVIGGGSWRIVSVP